jgi:hypothetical protein
MTSTTNFLIVIPIYRWPLNPSEALSVYRTIHTLSRHKICWLGPKEIEKNPPKFFGGKFIEYISFDNKFFKSTNTYNTLLKSLFFYEKIKKYDYLLIAQTDSLVFRDELSKWADYGYSYIGAPWFKGMDKPTNDYQLIAVGNGGFSLRNIKDCILFLNFYTSSKCNVNQLISNSFSSWKIFIKYIKLFFYKLNILSQLNEDIFWGILAPELSTNFTVPEPDKALNFSFEVAPEKMYELSGYTLPFGCHAWEKYNRKFWLNVLDRDYFDIPTSEIKSLISYD